MAIGKKGRTVGTLEVNVPFIPLEKITFVDPPKKVFVGTSVNYSVKVFDKAKRIRENTNVVFTSNNNKVAEFDNFANLIIKKSGKIPNFDFKPKSHYELGENLGMLDFDLATKTTGSRFVFVKDNTL